MVYLITEFIISVSLVSVVISKKKNVCKNNTLQLARYREMVIQALRLRFKRNSFGLKTIATCTDVTLLSC